MGDAMERRAAHLVQRDDLAVEEGAADVELAQAFGDGGKLRRPVLAGARENPAAAAGNGSDGTVAVVFDLVQPLPALGRPRHERGELRGDEAGQPRSLAFAVPLGVSGGGATRAAPGCEARTCHAAGPFARLSKQPGALLRSNLLLRNERHNTHARSKGQLKT